MLFKEIHRERLQREEGGLSELASMRYSDQPFNCLHSYLACIKKGMTRANNYYLEKEEWMAITSGKVDLLLEDIRTKVRAGIHLDTKSEDYKMTYILPFVAHILTNVADGESNAIVFSRAPEKAGDTTPYEVRG